LPAPRSWWLVWGVSWSFYFKKLYI
jgi:hypothetical protein